MKELLILSGKGGTGKTSLTACFARLASGNAVLTDCDVDASNLPMLLAPELQSCDDFFAGVLPEISSGCTGCGVCENLCRFQAIRVKDARAHLLAGCEGCGVCADHCPASAITLRERLCGKLCISRTASGTLFHADLLPGAENSGKLIAELRRRAREEAEKQGVPWIISDGPPGIGCPVISAASGVDHAVIVTEPSLSGLHDLKRLTALLRQFEIPCSVILNKADLHLPGAEALENYLQQTGIELLGKIPFDPVFPRSLGHLQTVLDGAPESPVSGIIREIWQKIMAAYPDAD